MEEHCLKEHQNSNCHLKTSTNRKYSLFQRFSEVVYFSIFTTQIKSQCISLMLMLMFISMWKHSSRSGLKVMNYQSSIFLWPRKNPALEFLWPVNKTINFKCREFLMRLNKGKSTIHLKNITIYVKLNVDRKSLVEYIKVATILFRNF